MMLYYLLYNAQSRPSVRQHMWQLKFKRDMMTLIRVVSITRRSVAVACTSLKELVFLCFLAFADQSYPILEIYPCFFYRLTPVSPRKEVFSACSYRHTRFSGCNYITAMSLLVLLRNSIAPYQYQCPCLIQFRDKALHHVSPP